MRGEGKTYPAMMTYDRLEGSSSHSFLLIPHYAGSVYTDPADADSVGTDPASAESVYTDPASA